MRYVTVDGVRVSAIGLGTWQFGSRDWGYGRHYSEHEAIAIARRALDLGVNLIDTAEIYGLGRSERIVGRAIAGRSEDVFLATKLYPALPVAPVVVDRARRSARRLGTEQIDLYQLHAANPAVPIGTTMRGMARLQSEGLVRNVGVSNLSLGAWQRAEEALGGAVLSNQIRYSLALRGAEQEVLPWAQANDRLVIAYSPLAQGLLGGRYDGTNIPQDVRRRNPLFLPDALEQARPLIRALTDVGTRHHATPAQVALAWLLRRPNVVAIPGASSVAQLEANVAAADIDLTDDDDELLRAASDRFRPQGGKGAVRWRRLRGFAGR